MANERQINKKEETTPLLHGVVCSCAGEHIAPVYKRVYVPELKRNLVQKVDETDLFEFIQSSRSETDLATLQKRFIALGEIPAVDPTLGSNDLTLFPHDIHGVYDMVNDINKSFDSLPETIKAIFGSADVYGKSLMDGSYTSKLMAGLKAGPVDTEKGEKEVKENE